MVLPIVKYANIQRHEREEMWSQTTNPKMMYTHIYLINNPVSNHLLPLIPQSNHFSSIYKKVMWFSSTNHPFTRRSRDFSSTNHPFTRRSCDFSSTNKRVTTNQSGRSQMSTTYSFMGTCVVLPVLRSPPSIISPIKL